MRKTGSRDAKTLSTEPADPPPDPGFRRGRLFGPVSYPRTFGPSDLRTLMPLLLSSFQAYFPENQLRGVQILAAALMVGIGLFLITVLVLNVLLEPVEAPIGGTEVLTIMTIMVLISTPAMIVLSRVVFQRMTSRARLMALTDRLPDHTTEPERVEVVVAQMRSAEIVRLALLEAPAAFGLGVCVIAISMGVLKSEPLYWVNVFPTPIFLTLVVLSFPSRERFEGVFREIKMG